MSKLYKTILSFWTLLIMTSCDSTKTDDLATTQPFKHQQNPLIGEWKYSNTIWHTSELTLYDNGTFKFHDQGCYGQKFTEGHWTSTEDTILLTSLTAFKIADTHTSTPPLVTRKLLKRKLKTADIEYTFVGLSDNNSNFLPGPNDTIKTYFDKTRLRLKNDTLYCVDKTEVLNNFKFYKTQNNR